MFRLLKWGFQLLIVLILLGALQRGYRFLMGGEAQALPFDLWAPQPTDAVKYQGIDWQLLSAAQPVEGTDIVFQGVENQEAVFLFPDGRSPRRIGDPLHYRGTWADVPQTDFTLNSRIVRVTAPNVILVSWYSLTLAEIAPIPRTVLLPASARPYTVLLRARKGSAVPGTTLLFQGRHAETGAALIEGQPGDERAQFQVMSSVNWAGQLREDLHVRYNLRVLFYTDSYLQLGGTATLIHPP